MTAPPPAEGAPRTRATDLVGTARRIAELWRSVAEAYGRTLRKVVEAALAVVEAMTPPRDRPAWRSPHGPAHHRRRPA